MCPQPRFEFSLAGETEDEALRILLRQISMPGDITLSFRREPSFFLAEQAGNITSQVIVCKDRQKDQLVGMGSRSIRCVYIDGKPTQVGYLSMLRGLPQARGNIALARGYRYLQTLHSDGIVPYYFTTILDDNTTAIALLTSARAGLPIYKPLARLTTYLIPLRRNRKIIHDGTGPIFRRGRFIASTANESASRALVQKVNQHLLSDALTFLQEWNSHYQFAPVYALSDMLGQTNLLPKFSWQNLYVSLENGNVNGTLGIWDQQLFKQTVVVSYSRKIQFLRPLYNLFASITGIPGLPQPGSEIKLLYAAFMSGSGNVFGDLLNQVRADWSGKGYDYLSVGLCEGDERTSVASRYATQQLTSTIYMVYWQDTNLVLPKMSSTVHLETATL